MKKPSGSVGNEEPEFIANIAAEKRPIKTAKLADLSGVSPRHLYDMVKENRIPFVDIGGAIRFDPKTTAAWFRDRVGRRGRR